jgi:flagellar motor component MotA
VNTASFLGLIIGILVIGLAATTSGVPLSVLWNPAGALIVVGVRLGRL